MKSVILDLSELNEIVNNMQGGFDVFAPKTFEGEGRFSNSDRVDYAKVKTFAEIDWNSKSSFSAKEFLLPVTENLVEISSTGVSGAGRAEPVVLFLRSCDLNAVLRMDKHFLSGNLDTDYQMRREKMFFILMECGQSWDSCFCKMMGTDTSDGFDMKIRSLENGCYRVFINNSIFDNYFSDYKIETGLEIQAGVEPEGQFEVPLIVPGDEDNAPEHWSETGRRCIGCGACNFVCPTCFCFGMRDEVTAEKTVRQRVWSSCQVKGFAKVSGGFEFRAEQKEKVRFKFLHKFKYFKQKHGVNLCVGCGRCVEICPEYIDIRKQVLDVNVNVDVTSLKQASEVKS